MQVAADGSMTPAEVVQTPEGLMIKSADGKLSPAVMTPVGGAQSPVNGQIPALGGAPMV